MTLPLKTIALYILEIEEYPKFMAYLPFNKQCLVSK